MKTNYALELSEPDRRRVRAAIGRGGLATRSEIRIFIERAVRNALAAAPEPKPARSRPLATPSTKRLALEQLQQFPDDSRCAQCERPKDEHGKMGLTCPPRPGRPRGTRFTPMGAL